MFLIKMRKKNGKNSSIFMICKISDFFEKPLLSGDEKHPDFQVTL